MPQTAKCNRYKAVFFYLHCKPIYHTSACMTRATLKSICIKSPLVCALKQQEKSVCLYIRQQLSVRAQQLIDIIQRVVRWTGNVIDGMKIKESVMVNIWIHAFKLMNLFLDFLLSSCSSVNSSRAKENECFDLWRTGVDPGTSPTMTHPLYFCAKMPTSEKIDQVKHFSPAPNYLGGNQKHCMCAPCCEGLASFHLVLF